MLANLFFSLEILVTICPPHTMIAEEVVVVRAGVV